MDEISLQTLRKDIQDWGAELGFSKIGITDTTLNKAEAAYQAWLAKGFHGDMDYMAKHGIKRTRPSLLVQGTLRVIAARCNYFPPKVTPSEEVLQSGDKAFISRYALGRDYHKVVRQKLQILCDKIQSALPENKFNYRVFTDSAPVLEVAIAEKAGLGWQGKHSLLITQQGSWFFLGEIYTNLPLPIDSPTTAHCGTCTRCLEVCPTQAIVAPYQVDARRCISYLTIEFKGHIPVKFRSSIGNRIYGCDDCQLVCPWNQFTQSALLPDFHVRHGLDNVSLVECFSWSETTFQQKMAGNAIYRIGHTQWLRNIAVALGNAPRSVAIVEALRARHDHPSALVREHVGWALEQHLER
ncbi:MAG: tRNA epoxyqueuosine(34) reductase QueG [Methylophilaceae bacterium]|nr:tRNA epoxyqueuosine(34) reductase QueG [Methylophilaceae bacterium]